MKKNILIPGLVVTIVGASMFAATTSFAQTTSLATDTGGQMHVKIMHGPQDDSSLVQKIADKFNLNKADVQAVFDEQHKEFKEKIKANQELRLSQAVKDGKLTEEQKTKILEKMKEMKAARDADMEEMKDKTPEEHRAAMEQKQTELKAWATENNIPMEYFFLGLKHHGEFKK